MADATRTRRLLATLALAGIPSLLTGCGGAPSRDDFVAKIKATIGSDLVAGMTAQGISESDAEQLIDDFVACQYDTLKDDPDLLQQAYDDPGATEVSTRLDIASQRCVEDLSTAMTTAIAEGSGPVSTTTTTLPGATTTTLPTADTVPGDATVLNPDPTIDTLPTTEPTLAPTTTP